MIIFTHKEQQQWYDQDYCLSQVKQDGLTLQYVKNPSPNIQLEAVKQNGYAIQYIHNPSETLQLEAVKQTGLSIKYIKNPSLNIQLEAIIQNPTAIQYTIQTFELIEEAIKSKLKFLELINFSILTDQQYQYLKLKYDIDISEIF